MQDRGEKRFRNI